MKKLPVILISVLVLAGGAYALVGNLFPDTPLFPRIPTGSGTIGGVISRILRVADLATYSGDGTVPNSLALSGRSSTGYLRSVWPCGPGLVHIGVKPDGTPECGSRTFLLTDYGKIDSQDCNANYYRADGTTGNTSTGFTLKSGDIVKTAPGCPMTIAFSDLSIIRLDGDTTVSLDLTTSATGATMASALLANGSLWGRILTETGSYSIGSDTVVAGVRGTSIYVNKNRSPSLTITPISGGSGWTIGGANMGVDLRAVHSSITSGKPISITCKDSLPASNTLTFDTLTGVNLNVSSSCHSLDSIAASSMPNQEATNTLYAGNPFIAKNTLADLKYMTGLLLRGDLSGPKRTKILTELAATVPRTIDEKTAICGDTGVSKTFWTSLLGTDAGEPCQESSTAGFARYDKSIPQLFTSGGTISPINGGFSGANMPHLVYSGATLTAMMNKDWEMGIEFTTGAVVDAKPQYLVSVNLETAYIRIAYDDQNRLLFYGNAFPPLLLGTPSATVKKITLSKKWDAPTNKYIISATYGSTTKYSSISPGTFSSSSLSIGHNNQIGPSYLPWNGTIPKVTIKTP